MKKIIALVLVCVMALTFVACGQPQQSAGTKTDGDLSYIQGKGEMIVGITDFEPMDYMDNGDWTGFDAELARLVGEKLGVKVKFQEIKWEMKETELSSKTIDCIWNGLTWDEERAQNMAMSDKYMKNHQVVVTKAENKEKYSNIENFKSASVAAESGSAGEDFIKESLKDSKYIEKDAQIDVLTELLAGTVDAGVIDYVMAYYLINKPGSSFSSLAINDDAIKTEDEFYAIAFRKGSDAAEAVNKALKELKDEGKIEELAKKYSLETALIK